MVFSVKYEKILHLNYFQMLCKEHWNISPLEFVVTHYKKISFKWEKLSMWITHNVYKTPTKHNYKQTRVCSFWYWTRSICLICLFLLDKRIRNGFHAINRTNQNNCSTSAHNNTKLSSLVSYFIRIFSIYPEQKM